MARTWLITGVSSGFGRELATQLLERDPAALRLVLGSQALPTTLDTLRARLPDFESETELAASTDYPPGHSRPVAATTSHP